MNQIAIALIEAITAFIATSIDDLLILLIFFAQVKEERLTTSSVLIGSYLGFSIIILLSLVGFLGGLVISPKWIGILGFLPIIIGIKQILEGEEEGEIQTVTSEYAQPNNRHPLLKAIYKTLHPQTYKVALITFANGGDNIGVYMPLFATSNLITLITIVIMFLALKGIWCYIAYRLMDNPEITDIITDYGSKFVPYLLILLGVFILWKNETITIFL